MPFDRHLAVAIAALVLGFATAAKAEDAKPITFTVTDNLDVMGVAAGGAERGARVLDKLLVGVDIDLEAGLGWHGAKLHLSGMATPGGRPNDLAGTLQGIDNIEVAQGAANLYEAWADQTFAGGAADLRLGLYDTNSEFDVTDSSALLLGPTFGISSEFAATGPAGPSIFPSTALAVRLNLQPSKDVYVRAAAVNALAGDPGDPGGVNLDFSGGALVMAEAGWTGRGKLALGAWTYTQRQPDNVLTLPNGDPKPSRSWGVYMLADQPVIGPADAPRASVFVRAGISDGNTGPFKAAAAAGFLLAHPIASRPEGQLSAAVSAGWLAAGGAETALEITYADHLTDHLVIQPDFQFVLNPGGGHVLGDAVILGLRLTLSYP